MLTFSYGGFRGLWIIKPLKLLWFNEALTPILTHLVNFSVTLWHNSHKKNYLITVFILNEGYWLCFWSKIYCCERCDAEACHGTSVILRQLSLFKTHSRTSSWPFSVVEQLGPDSLGRVAYWQKYCSVIRNHLFPFCISRCCRLLCATWWLSSLNPASVSQGTCTSSRRRTQRILSSTASSPYPGEWLTAVSDSFFQGVFWVSSCSKALGVL